MVTLSLKLNKQLSTSTDISIRDNTGNLGDTHLYKDANGNLQQATNTSGYGATTLVKSTVARVLLCRYEGRDAKSMVLPKGYNAADPAVDDIDFAYYKDGWHRFMLLAYNLFDEFKIYAAGERAFHPELTGPYKGSVREWDGLAWKTISWEDLYVAPEKEMSLAKAVASTVLNKLFLRNSWMKYRSWLIKLNGMAADCICDTDLYQLELKGMQHRRLAASSVDAFCRGMRPEGQRMAESLIDLWKGAEK